VVCTHSAGCAAGIIEPNIGSANVTPISRKTFRLSTCALVMNIVYRALSFPSLRTCFCLPQASNIATIAACTIKSAISRGNQFGRLRSGYVFMGVLFHAISYGKGRIPLKRLGRDTSVAALAAYAVLADFVLPFSIRLYRTRSSTLYPSLNLTAFEGPCPFTDAVRGYAFGSAGVLKFASPSDDRPNRKSSEMRDFFSSYEFLLLHRLSPSQFAREKVTNVVDFHVQLISNTSPSRFYNHGGEESNERRQPPRKCTVQFDTSSRPPLLP